MLPTRWHGGRRRRRSRPDTTESLADQEQCVALFRRLGQPDLAKAERHCDIIRRFGRFPHRNPILGRATTEEEQRYLDGGGYGG
jgi:uncharacterized protein (DUF924 family)